jgi:hypothetical protein
MGDTPINLDSPDDRSKLFYSCKVKDKSRWAGIFNLGHEIRGAGRKPKRRTRMSRADFKRNVVNETESCSRPVAVNVPIAGAWGVIQPARRTER